MSQPLSLSLLIPAYNEAANVFASAEKYLSYLQGLQTKKVLGDFEVIVIFNGCTDGSDKLLEKLAEHQPNLKVESIPERGLGLALKCGIEKSKMSHAMFYSVDVPFGLEIIEQSMIVAASKKEIGMVIGSKGHPESHVKRPFIRTLVSGILNFLLRLFLKLKIRDTQGSQFFLSEPIKKDLAGLQSPGPFFQVELILSLKKQGFEIVEIPVVHTEQGRASKMKILRDATRALQDLIKQIQK